MKIEYKIRINNHNNTSHKMLPRQQNILQSTLFSNVTLSPQCYQLRNIFFKHIHLEWNVAATTEYHHIQRSVTKVRGRPSDASEY